MGGRNKEGEITAFTIPDTGITLKVRRVSYVLLSDVQKQIEQKHPEPKPPMNTVNYGAGDVQEANYADPDYQLAVKNRQDAIDAEMEEASRRLLIYQGVLPYLEWDEEKQAEVKALRESMQELFGVELDKNDKYVWVTRIAIGTVEDWQDFTLYLMRRAKATEAGVQETLKKF